ncbi:MAG: rRNA maturation RNase YbeY [bacterium]
MTRSDPSAPLRAEINRDMDDWPDMGILVQKCFDCVTMQEFEWVSRGLVSILLTDDAHIAVLNHKFRHKQGATNILSFPAGAPLPGQPDNAPQLLGDLVLAYETCQREAIEKNIPFADHIAHLLFHGLLHLYGFDHIEETQAQEMEALETALMKKMGLDDPYQ